LLGKKRIGGGLLKKTNYRGRFAVQERTSKCVIGKEGIMGILPHRDPFIFVDGVLEIEPGQRIVAFKDVLESHCAGHFPGKPVFPGVFTIEAMAQACCLLALWDNPGASVLFRGVGDLKFRQAVKPGDRLILMADLEKVKGPLWVFNAKALMMEIDGKEHLVTSTQISATTGA